MDAINGLFESLGAVFILTSIVKLHREKMVRGVSWIHAAFFTTWGYFNLWFYFDVGLYMSWAGGIGVVIANTIWLGQLVYYSREGGRREVPA